MQKRASIICDRQHFKVSNLNKNEALYFVTHLAADDSYEMPSLIFTEKVGRLWKFIVCCSSYWSMGKSFQDYS